MQAPVQYNNQKPQYVRQYTVPSDYQPNVYKYQTQNTISVSPPVKHD